MNIRKSIVVAAAMLVTAAGMTGIANYSNAAADSARHAVRASAIPAAEIIKTLPTINVTPSREQLRELRNEQGGKTGSASAASTDTRMPFYSFASDEAGA